MSLPVFVRPTFDVQLASRPKKVRCQAMTVAEKKLLLVAMETGNSMDLLREVDECVKRCLVDYDASFRLSLTDKVLIFLEIRRKSMGDLMALSAQCSKCEEWGSVNVDLKEVKVTKATIPPAGAKNTFKVELIGGIGLLVRDPDISDLLDLKLNDLPTSSDAMIGVITRCIVGVYDNDSVYWVEDLEEGELTKWLEQMPLDGWEMIENHFMSRPTITLNQQWTCKNGHKNIIELTELSHFFV